ncbi:permease [Marinospirillum perlucidum]|uniref:permease n=1 Tax=Marinospirillum perlucidum TaxID=1982602 RepID=UPI000DF1B356|nr:permease [Marinospirillum perlucidum]
MNYFLDAWSEAALTSLGFFWMALWAFALGYLISSLIQVLVTRSRMQKMMGDTGFKSISLGTFFGFISSSCSFAALSGTRALFQRGAGLVPSLAFLLASTNLVVELGIVIALFLSWQFVVGEYIGGLLLIIFAWLFVAWTRPDQLIKEARQRLAKEHQEDEKESQNWKQKLFSSTGWQQIGKKYVMEWQMVWKDVLIGFTVAGVIAAFVPDAFFETLFIGSGGEQAQNPGFGAVLAQTLIGPVAAFFTFIGSMGNIPLAALLFDQGVSFAGVMAFIFSDLVVLPILRINARYYGWKLALYILVLLLTCLVAASLVLHYSFAFLDLLPSSDLQGQLMQRDKFAINTGFFLNLIFLAFSGLLGWQAWKAKKAAGHEHHHHHHGSVSLTDRILQLVAGAAAIWLAAGLLIALVG